MNLGHFLIKQLRLYGAEHIFGIPGDYTLNFMREIEQNPGIEYVGVSREDSAGYAADAYGRLRGCGAVCITYSVGAMNIMNAVAGAYAEKSPMVVLVGKPSEEDLKINPNRHHTISTGNTQKEIFKNITCNAYTLDSEDMFVNMAVIHLALNQMRTHSRPVYIEFSNKDIMKNVDHYLSKFYAIYGRDVPYNEKTKIVDLPYKGLDKFVNAKNRVLIIGHEVFRNTLEDRILEFAKKLNIPIFTTLLGKSTISEFEPNCLGCVSELFSDISVIDEIKKSDCIVSLGMVNTDVESFSWNADISINMDDGIRFNNEPIKEFKNSNLGFPELVSSFISKFEDIEAQDPSGLYVWNAIVESAKAEVDSSVDSSPIKLECVFDLIGKLVTDDHIIISDIGESLFGMIDVPVSKGQFMCMAYYTSMSFSVPAAVGVKFAKPNKRPIVIVGDGAFQMTGSEFSTHIRNNLNTIVIILNNRGYSTEKAIMEGEFNDIHNWNYEKITDLTNGGVGVHVQDSIQFKEVFEMAIADESESYVLNVEIDPTEQSIPMKSIVQKLCIDNL
jgi:indolepyruvate decarboxylase